jgi:hypothetical protein
MTISKSIAVLLLLATGDAKARQSPPAAIVTTVMTKALADYPGKEAVVLTVEYPRLYGPTQA